MKLGGWRRLWIAVSGVYAIAVMGFAALTYPHDLWEVPFDSVQQQMSPEHAAIVVGAGYPISSGRYRVVPRGYDEMGKVRYQDGRELRFVGTATNGQVAAVTEEYWRTANTFMVRRQWLFVLITVVLGWIVPVASLYGLGRTVGWVYGGFRQP